MVCERLCVCLGAVIELLAAEALDKVGSDGLTAKQTAKQTMKKLAQNLSMVKRLGAGASDRATMTLCARLFVSLDMRLRWKSLDAFDYVFRLPGRHPSYMHLSRLAVWFCMQTEIRRER